MAFRNNLHYITENLPRYISNHLPNYIADYLQPRGSITDHFPDNVTDKFQKYVQECRPVFDTIQNLCIPSSTVIAAIFVYLFLALLLSR